ncbi:hypothetical protein [Sorangium sp. So ce1335]|uniref:hypothetical protein n=1 Tax=Sorangium sp. So ce1335 TaxID=3133335 RepID=UPI003F5D861C
MKRDLRSVRALCGAGLLASSVGGCTTIIGLEVGELDPSTSSATASSGSTGGGDHSVGGQGGGGGEGGSDSSGGGGQGGGGQGGGEEALCRDTREGAARPPSGLWGDLAGDHIIDIEAHEGGVTALVNGATGFSVARWNDNGSRADDFGMDTPEQRGDLTGEHLAMAGGLTYVTGTARPLDDAALTTPLLAAGCEITAKASDPPKPSFVAALDERGTCQWAWSVDAESTTYPLGLAAAPDQVVFAVSLAGLSLTSTTSCIVSDVIEAKTSADLVAIDTSGACRWRRSLGPTSALRIAELVIDPANNEVLAVGDYDSPDGPLLVQRRPLPASQGSDLFIARFRLLDGELQDIFAINAPGAQSVARHGAALHPDGDLVIGGTYTGPSFDFEDECAPMPPASEEEENIFIVRVSREGLVWSRGFGDVAEDQLVANVAVDAAGSIYVTGHLEGEMDLGDEVRLTAPEDQISGFLLVLSDKGNVLSASELVGEGTVGMWAVAPGPTVRDPLYIAGEMTETFHLVPGAQSNGGFIARVAGVP